MQNTENTENIEYKSDQVFDASHVKAVQTPNNDNVYIVKSYYVCILLAFLALYISPYFLDIPNIWLTQASMATKALEFMSAGDFYLAPMLANDEYLYEFPLVFWLLQYGNTFFGEINATDYLFFFYIFSIVLYASTIFLFCICIVSKPLIALTAVCIFFTSFFSITYMQFVGFDLFFASLVNLSLIFYYKAWRSNSARVSLFLAFVFTTLAFLSGGIFALFLPLFSGIVFTSLCGKPTRLAKDDGLFGAFFLFVSCGILFILFYYHEHGSYLYSLSDLLHFGKAWQNTSFLTHIQYYSIFIVLAFMPYIFLFFIPNSYSLKQIQFPFFKKKEKILSAVEIPDPSEVQGFSEENKEEIVEVSDIVSLKNSDIQEEKDIPNASFKLIEEKEEEVYKAFQLHILFLYSVVFVGIILLSLFPYTSYSYILLIAPALCVLFAHKIVHMAQGRASKIFFSLYAWIIVLLGFTSIFFAMLPELLALRPEFFTFIAPQIVQAFSLVPKVSFFIFAFIVFTLALYLLFTHKANSQYAFTRILLPMLIIAWTLNLTVYPHIVLQEENTPSEEITEEEAEIYEENSTLLEQGKALLEQSEDVLEHGKYFFQLPKSLLPKEELEEPIFDDPLEGLSPLFPRNLQPILPPQIPLEELLELKNPNLPTYSL